MDNKYINIVYTADKNYTDIISVSMFSVLKNLSKDKIARFFVFSQDFNSNDIEKLNKLKKSYTCEIINVPMEPYLDFLNFADITTFKNKYISLACYFRLLIFKILPEYVKECFYIDGDMLIDTDISKIKLSKDKIFSAVIEAHAMQYREKILAHLKDYVDFKNFIINPLKFPYFNAGFFLVNLEKAKQINIMEDLLDFLKRYPNPPYADQDTLNAIFGQKYIDLIEYLPPEYNIFTSNDKNKTYDKLPYPDKTLKKAISKPKIIHYAGQNKPWNTLNVNHLYKYWKYWFKSPYKNIAIKYLTNILCKKFNQKLEKIKKTILAFVISYESNTLFLNPNSNINLTIKTLEFNKNNKNFIKNNKARKKKRLFLTTGNLSLLNTICVIKQTNEECDDYLFIHSHLKSDSFHTTCLKMAESHNFKKIYTLYEKILDFRQYFIHNKLYNFDEIYFSNQYQFLLLANTLYKNTKKYITDEGCTGKLMRAKIFNYDKIKNFYFNDYSPKIDYWNLSKKNTKKIIKIDKQIFKSVTDEFAKKLPANINIDKNSKTILFCGS